MIADDHVPLRLGLAALIGMQPNLLLVAEAENGIEAIEKAFVLN